MYDEKNMVRIHTNVTEANGETESRRERIKKINGKHKYEKDEECKVKRRKKGRKRKVNTV